MSLEDMIEGGNMSSIEVLDIDEVIGSLGRDAVDPYAETVRIKRQDRVEVLAERLEALCDASPTDVRLAPIS